MPALAPSGNRWQYTAIAENIYGYYAECSGGSNPSEYINL
jgi:hypothetical protein